MRTSLLVTISFAFVVSSGIVARSQENDPMSNSDLTLIHDVETSPPSSGVSGSKAIIRSKPAPAAIEKSEKPAEHLHAVTKPAAAKESGVQDAVAGLPANLEEAVAQALQWSPKLLLAEVKLRQAQAEFDEAKLDFVHDVTVAFHQRNALRQKLEYTKKMLNKGYAVPSEVQELTDELQFSESKLAYMLGVGREQHAAEPLIRTIITTPLGEYKKTYIHVRSLDEDASKEGAADKAAVSKHPEIPEKYRKVLQKPVKVKFTAMTLDQIIDQLNQETGDELLILRQVGQAGQVQSGDRILNLELAEELPLQTVMEMVADVTGCVFVFRDYGLLVVPQNFRAHYPRAAMIPEGAGGGGF